MIQKNGRVATGIHQIGRTATAAYKVVGGVAVLIWTAIRSCFGKGYWIDDKPWIDDDAWKD